MSQQQSDVPAAHRKSGNSPDASQSNRNAKIASPIDVRQTSVMHAARNEQQRGHKRPDTEAARLTELASITKQRQLIMKDGKINYVENEQLEALANCLKRLTIPSLASAAGKQLAELVKSMREQVRR